MRSSSPPPLLTVVSRIETRSIGAKEGDGGDGGQHNLEARHDKGERAPSVLDKMAGKMCIVGRIGASRRRAVTAAPSQFSYSPQF